METLEIIKLVLVGFIGLFILKFLWNLVSGIIKLLIITIIVGVGIYIVKPELIYDVIGKENTEMVVNKAKNALDTGKTLVIEKGGEFVKENLDSLRN